jgi:hypothetical protein
MLTTSSFRIGEHKYNQLPVRAGGFISAWLMFLIVTG